ncbi:MAG: PQQ-binding-like beta-propeller repeat protein [Thermoguttaceae bacterium]|jgi:outer membrane protein assembly factor BamB
MQKSSFSLLLPGLMATLGIAALVYWAGTGPIPQLQARVPGLDKAPAPGPAKTAKRPVQGQPVYGPGKSSALAGAWPCFRGAEHDAICKDEIPLARQWPEGGPEKLWTVELGDGYAAAAVSAGRVYVLDHVHDAPIDQLRGLSPGDRETLASALASTTLDKFDSLESLLRRLLPAKGGDPNDPERGVSEEEFIAVKNALGSLLAGNRNQLIHALRNDALDEIDRSADVMRCLSLDDGREIWRNGYPVIVPWSHGRSRTIPAVAGKYVVSIGPQCQAAGWDAETGKGLWLIDMVLDYGAVVPPWYTGQCPLVDEKTERLILAPGGKALLISVDYKTGKVVWESPNPHHWTMTHASVVPMEYAGRRMYVYCGKGGVAGVAADTGEILWETDQWQIGTATCPSPVVAGEAKIFFCGGYNVGSLMLQLRENNAKFQPEILFRLTAKQFSSEQQTPLLFNGFLYGVRQHDKKLVCLDLNGKEVWNSGQEKFGSAPYMIADGLIFVISDDGLLATVEATTAGYKPLARAQVIEKGYESWGPMAMAAGRLIVRDMTRMVCLKVSEK